ARHIFLPQHCHNVLRSPPMTSEGEKKHLIGRARAQFRDAQAAFDEDREHDAIRHVNESFSLLHEAGVPLSTKARCEALEIDEAEYNALYDPLCVISAKE